MILKDEIDQKSKEQQITTANVQRDYLFGWLLNYIFTQSELKDSLFLKGGNALRKAYFIKTRFSTDLDFGTPNDIDQEFLKQEIEKACQFVSEKAGIAFVLERNDVREKFNWNEPRWKVFEVKIYFKDFYGNSDHITLTLGNIYLLLQSPFYYGVFEYPHKSGNFYTGKHEPLITKELFDQVQLQVKSQVLRTQEPKEFAFTKMMTCGLCGSGICADEKFKKLKDGSVNRHIYYGCTKAKDKDCKCGYINELELIEQFEKLLNKISINEIGMKDKIKEEIQRIKRFQQSVLGVKQEIQISDIDIRDYAKFILKDGSIEEKRELLTCFKSKILLKNKEVEITYS